MKLQDPGFGSTSNRTCMPKVKKDQSVSTIVMSSEMNNFLFLEAREGTGKKACTHQQALHL